jgi:hypothetical protein
MKIGWSADSAEEIRVSSYCYDLQLMMMMTPSPEVILIPAPL